MKPESFSSVISETDQSISYNSEIRMHSSGFTPINRGTTHQKPRIFINDNDESQTTYQPRSSHDPLLAQHLGLGTDYLTPPLTEASGNKKKRTQTSHQSKTNMTAIWNTQTPEEQLGTSPSDQLDTTKLSALRGNEAQQQHARKRVKPNDAALTNFFNTSKYVEPPGLLDTTIDKAAHTRLELETLPSDFDYADQLLSDADLQVVYNDELDTQVCTSQTAMELGMDGLDVDDGLFETFIEYPPRGLVGEWDVDDDDLADEDLMGIMVVEGNSQGGMELQVNQTRDDGDEDQFNGAWLDELDEYTVRLLIPE